MLRLPRKRCGRRVQKGGGESPVGKDALTGTCLNEKGCANDKDFAGKIKKETTSGQKIS